MNSQDRPSCRSKDIRGKKRQSIRISLVALLALIIVSVQSGFFVYAYQREYQKEQWRHIIAGMDNGFQERAASRDSDTMRSGNALRLKLKDAPTTLTPEQVKWWIGKRVAFEYVDYGRLKRIGEGMWLDIDFNMDDARVGPIVTSAWIVGTVEAVDVKNKIIRIKAKYSDRIIECTG
jgi:hypothetical protein